MGKGYSGVGGGPTTTLSQIPFFHFTNQKRETFGFGEGRGEEKQTISSPEKRSQGSPNPAGPAPLLFTPSSQHPRLSCNNGSKEIEVRQSQRS